MTGFGTATRPWVTPTGDAVLEVEVRSVNGRHLDVRVRQPWGAGAEQAVRQLAEARCGRGRVDVTVTLRPPAAAIATDVGAVESLGVEPVRLRQVLRAAAEVHAVALEVGLEISASNALDFLRFAAVSSRPATTAGTPDPPPFLEDVVVEAVDAMVGFRTAEGDALHGVLATLMAMLRADVARIAALADAQGAPLAARLHRRVRELCDAARVQAPDETRLAQEVALLAAKGDVAEEIARLAMHLDRATDVLAAAAAPGQGRTLEFVAQELLREFTTIGSKIVSHEAASIVIDAKGTLERIREQVSNVE